MSSQLADVTSSVRTRSAVPEQSATTEKPETSFQFKMIRLMRDLKDLLLLKSAELYCKLWQELKLEMLKSLKMTCITADNTHIAKLTNAVKVMISKQKQQATALIKAISFTVILQFRVTAAATDFSLIHEVSTCLAREIVIRCFNTTSENHI